MRLPLTLLLLSLLLGVGGRAGMPVAAQETRCSVTSNYQEAAQENTRTLIKMLALTHTEPSPLDNPEIAAVYYAMLASTRHYHEEQRATLPACAHQLNNVLIETITATQDVIALMLIQDATPETTRNTQRLDQAKTFLSTKWSDLSTVSDATPFVTENAGSR